MLYGNKKPVMYKCQKLERRNFRSTPVDKSNWIGEKSMLTRNNHQIIKKELQADVIATI